MEPLNSPKVTFGPDSSGISAPDLPFVLGVMAGLSGSNTAKLPPLAEREFIEVDVDNFEDFLKSSQPRVTFQVPNTLAGQGLLPVDLTLQSLKDFSPAAIARKIEPLHRLLALRADLLALPGRPDAQAAAEKYWQELSSQFGAPMTLPADEALRAPMPKSDSDSANVPADSPTDFLDLMNRPVERKADLAQQAVKTGGQRIVDELLKRSAAVVPKDVTDNIQRALALVDRKLSEQINVVLHHDDFQQLEATWRGLHYFVFKTETDESLKIKVLNLSRKELAQSLRASPSSGARVSNPQEEPGQSLRRPSESASEANSLFSKFLVEPPASGRWEPLCCLIGDYHFDHSPVDVKVLAGLAEMAAAAQAPFISGAAPSLFGITGWPQLPADKDLSKTFQQNEYLRWRSLRESEESRYLGLTCPRFLARLPYGPETESVEEFDFEEDLAGGEHRRFLWANAAYLMGVNIARASKQFGWGAAICGREGGGLVDGLPSFKLAAGDSEDIGPTEIALADDLGDLSLERHGIILLTQIPGTSDACFDSAPSLNRSKKFEGPSGQAATAQANLLARLPYLLLISRLTQLLRAIVMASKHRSRTRAELQDHLNAWINHFVVTDLNRAGTEEKARRPFAAAQVEVRDSKAAPGACEAVLRISPRLEPGAPRVTLRVVVDLVEAEYG